MHMSKTLLTLRGVASATTAEALFSNVSTTVKDHDRIGVVGKNGTGKSTLLRLLNKEIEPDTGTVLQAGVVGYVPQVADESHYHKTVAEFLETQAVSYAVCAATFSQVFSSPVPPRRSQLRDLSGGERTKLWIAVVAARTPAALLLDEPTNHLDQTSQRELADWLNRYTGAVVLVSHNRWFLSVVAKTIWELRDRTLTVYGGGYGAYRQQKEEQANAEVRQYQAVQKQRGALKRGIARRETKAARATRAGRRSKYEKNREKSVENYFRNRSEKGIGALKQQQEKKQAELTAAAQSLRPSQQRSVNVPLQSAGRPGQLILDTTGLRVLADSQQLLVVPRLRIEVGSRISIAGENGSGKTQLLKTLQQELATPSPGITNVGHDVPVACIDQHYDLISRLLTVYENLVNATPAVDEESVYKQLGRFQFPEYYLHKPAATLSGGEIARLAFAMATFRPLDLLILDEPTNHLDIETVEIITEALQAFPGALLVVSHDRVFLEELDITQRYLIAGGTLTEL